MEGFGNYDPDADAKRPTSVVEKGMHALVNLGDYVPETWKSKLGLYDLPRAHRSPRGAPPPSHAGSLYTSGSFHFERPSAPQFGAMPFSARQVASEGYRRSVDELPRGVVGGWPRDAEAGVVSANQTPRVFSPVAVGEYEARLVKRIVQPRGGRVQPSSAELTTFKRGVEGLDLRCVFNCLKDYICDADLTWQWKLRALATLQALAEKRIDGGGACGVVVDWINEDAALRTSLQSVSRQKQCQPLAAALLALGGHKPPPPPPSSSPALLDLLAEEELAVTAVPAPAAAPSAKPSLLDDLL